MSRIVNRLVTILVIAIACVGAPSAAHALCLTPPGDITADGDTDINDVQCSILFALSELTGGASDSTLMDCVFD